MLTEFITWTANPALYDGFIEIRWYGLFFSIGFIVGYNMMERMFCHEQVNLKWLDSLFIYVVIATVLGARLGHCLFYAWDYYSQHPLEILKVWEGGLASHGGAIGIIIAIWLYSRRVTHRNMLWTFDRLVVPVALVAALIRTGNLMNHEIYGHVTTLPWGFRFIQNLSEWMKGAAPIFTEPSHPTQIYEALCYLLLFGLLLYMYWKRNAEEREGLIFGTFLIGIFLPRFCIEFIKNNQEAPGCGWLFVLCLDRECRLNLRRRRRNRLYRQSYVFLFLTPLLRNYRPFGVFPIALRLPVMLRGTAGGRSIETLQQRCYIVF